MSKIKMNNETEFILSQDLSAGFTVLNNTLLNAGLSYNAIGLYSTIIQKAYIPGWKVYQATLINAINKKAATSNGIKELVEFGLITKEQVRDKKGHIKGVKYTINAIPTRTKNYETGIWNDVIDVIDDITINVSTSKANDVETVEKTNVEPKSEKPISVKPISVKRPLINKDVKKERTLKKKDKTTTIEKNTKANSSSSVSEEVKNYKITLAIKPVTKMNIKRKKLTVEQLELLEQYVLLQDNIDNLDSFSCYIAQEIKEGNITEKDLVAAKTVKKAKSKNIQSKLINRADIAKEYAAIEEEFLNISAGTDYENEDLPF